MSRSDSGSNFYVRHRGRITGPYALPDLLTLVKRGTVSRAHELSGDAVNWVPADRVPGVFKPRKGSPAGAAATIGPAVESDDAARPGGMYFQEEGQAFGPVPPETLQSLAAEGRLKADTIVWAEADTQSYPASDHPLLAHMQWPVAEAPVGGEGGKRKSWLGARMGCGTALVIGALLLLCAGIAISIWMSSSPAKPADTNPAGGKLKTPGGANDQRQGAPDAGSGAPPATPMPQPNHPS